MWLNDSLNISQQTVGTVKYQKLINKNKEATQSCLQDLLGIKSLSYASHQAIKHVNKNRHKMALVLRRYNAAGAVGYAHVVRGNPLKHLAFFSAGRCYKLRFRLSNMLSKDDASSCVREAAVKFCDQDHDGPFDLIMYTGRLSLARDSNSFLDLLKLSDPDKLKKMCLSDPFFHRALVDGLRKGPSSYSDLTFHSHLCYRAVMSDGTRKLVKFRLVPMYRYEEYKQIKAADLQKSRQVKESGHLEQEDQKQPWKTGRGRGDDRDNNYLKKEIKGRLGRGEAVKYYLEVQIGPPVKQADYDDRNPQLLWDEASHPWSKVMEVELTTSLSSYCIRNTRYNPTDKPKGLIFPVPGCPQDPFSLQKVLMSVYTEIEMKGTGQVCDPRKSKFDDSKRVWYKITVVSESLNVNRPIPYVEIYVTLLGIKSRSIPMSLNNSNQHNKIWDKVRNHRKEEYKVECDSVENMLGVFVEVYYRHITEHWFLRQLTVEEEDRNDKKWVFPCYEVVETPVLVFPGDVCLANKQTSEASKKERIFQLKERRVEYMWEDVNAPLRLFSETGSQDGEDNQRDSVVMMPGCIRNPRKVDGLPFRHRSRWIKYTGLRWEVDPKLVEFYREIRFNRALKKSKLSVKNRRVVKRKGVKGRKKGKRTQRVRPDRMRFDVLDVRRSGGGRDRGKSDGGGMGMSDGGGGEESEDEEKVKRSKNIVSRQSSYAGKSANNLTIKDLIKLNHGTPLSEGDEEDGDDADGNDTQDDSGVVSGNRSRYKEDEVFDVVDGRLPRFDERRANREHWPNANLESQFPDGSPGDMCRFVDDDYKFALSFLVGTNPRIIRKCYRLPDNFPVTDRLIDGLINNPLEHEIKEGRVYICDYEILEGISTVHHEADHRFIAAPLVLLHCNQNGDLMPLAIQLKQKPGSFNSVLTPNSPAAEWMHAKLWVRCSDFNHQFATSHLFTTHFLMEPFLIATMRCLPPCHPVCKILLPHFRNLLLSNTMLRHHLFSERGPIDTFTSLGRKGFQELMEKHYARFTFKHLNPIRELESRGVMEGLPSYFYRDDSIKLFNCILSCCTKLLHIHYPDPELDLQKDYELSDWFGELNKNGFPGNRFDFFNQSQHTNSRFVGPSAPSRNDFEGVTTPINHQPLPSYPSSVLSSLIITHPPPLNHSPPTYYQSFDEPDGKTPLLSAIPDIAKNSSTIYDEINFAPFNEDSNNTKFNAYNKSNIKEDIFEQKTSVDGQSATTTYPNLHPYKNVNSNPIKDLPSVNSHTIEGLAELLASIIFTTTCLHSATRSDALDIFGFVPDIPAMMKIRPIDQPISIDSSYLSKLLPDQSPDAYFTSLLFILNHYRADQNLLTDIDETYFVDAASKSELMVMRKEMKRIAFDQNVRNSKKEILYESLVPSLVSASPEPLPFIPHHTLKKIVANLGPSFTLNSFLEQRQPASMWHYVLDLCLSFHEVLGGRSTKGLYALCGRKGGGMDDVDGRNGIKGGIGGLTRGQTYDEIDRGKDDIDASNIAKQKRKMFSRRTRFKSMAE